MIKRQWWEQRWFLPVIAVLSTVPLLYPAVPVWGDLPAHFGMYRVALEHGDPASPVNHFYQFAWKMQGNMGVDLLVMPLAQLLPLELAAKIVLIATIALTTAAMLALSREVNGRVSPMALFAVPLAYSFTFQFGMANYSLSMGLAIGGLALWLRWGRLGRLRRRAVVFLLAAPLLWTCHIFGWATLCVLCGTTELWGQLQRGDGVVAALRRTILACSVLATPLAFTLIWRSGGTGFASDWFDLKDKISFMRHSLSAIWPMGEVQSVFVKIALLLIIAAAFAWQRRWTVQPRMRLAIGALLLLFVLLPTTLFGSYAADGRLFPYIMIIVLLSLDAAGAPDERMRARSAWWGLGFIIVELAAMTVSFAATADAQERRMRVLDRLPAGARLVTFVGGGEYCRDHEYNRVMNHLPSMALVRRRAFANDQFQNDQLMRVIYPSGAAPVSQARDYYHDESQLIANPACRRSPFDAALSRLWTHRAEPRDTVTRADPRSADYTLAHLPRDRFDYVWLIAPPPFDPGLLRGLTAVAREGDSTLYMVNR